MDPLLTRKTCFVVAPPDIPVASFLEALRELRIDPFFISDFLNTGSPAISQIREGFRTADFVVALLFSEKSIGNVFFEIGLALGAGRPLLLFADSSTRLPSDLAGVSVIRLKGSDISGAIPHIKKFLEPKIRSEAVGLAPPMATAEYRSKPKLRGSELRNEVQRIRNLSSGNLSPALFESELSRLMGRIGWTVAEARLSAKAYGPDMAVWIDDIQKEIGNPIAIEVKMRLGPGDLDRTTAQLSRYLESSGAKAGVILYDGPKQNSSENIAQISPLIFMFSLDEFAGLLETNKFSAKLKSGFSATKRLA